MIRFLDIVFSFVGLLILCPFFLLIALWIVLDSRGGVFYCQMRVGKNGKDFKLYKFRSMRSGADKRGLITVGAKDARITRSGYFLRKYKLDELPQLINVLKGEMSFVGPRPVVKDELEKYGNNKDKFLSVKPGLTGYWATHGRSDISYEERMELELYYVEHASLLLDTQIFFLTFIAVFAHRGAC